LLLLATVALCSLTTQASTNTRIVLDTTTFPPISRPFLQETADQVAKTVDQLVPGDYPNGRNPKILCFVAKGKWGQQPRAFVGKPKKIEPVSAQNYDMRISLTPEVLPGAWQRLVFQLAHELAHQKMDARVDNNAMEAFAVALSLEVLHRLGYDPYREGNERYYARPIPPEVMLALGRRDWLSVGLYIRYQWRLEFREDWTRPTQFLAAMALRKMGNFPWNRLLNIGATAECGTNRPDGWAQFCPLSPASLEGFPESIKAVVGRNELTALIMRTDTTQPEGGGLTFKEKGKWVSLRWSRRSDPVMPDGFLPLD
jgi:hypothetical protein